MVWGCGFMAEGLGFGRFCTRLEDTACRGGSQHEGFPLKNPYDRSILEATGSTLMSREFHISQIPVHFAHPTSFDFSSTSDLFRKRTRRTLNPIVVSIFFSIILI